MLDFVATSAAVRIIGGPVYRAPHAAPPLDGLMLFGFLAAFLTLVLWLYDYRQSKAQTLAFAGCILMLSLYCFLVGAWPMGIVATAWCFVTAREGLARNRGVRRIGIWPRRQAAITLTHADMESRMTRMFGPNRG